MPFTLIATLLPSFNLFCCSHFVYYFFSLLLPHCRHHQYCRWLSLAAAISSSSSSSSSSCSSFAWLHNSCVFLFVLVCFAWNACIYYYFMVCLVLNLMTTDESVERLMSWTERTKPSMKTQQSLIYVNYNRDDSICDNCWRMPNRHCHYGNSMRFEFLWFQIEKVEWQGCPFDFLKRQNSRMKRTSAKW